MLGVLFRTQLAALFASLFRGSGGRKSRGLGFKLLAALLAVFVLGCLLFYMGTLFDALAAPLAAAGLGWLYFALAGLVAAGLAFILSVFMAQQQLFNARDNDLLLSMPIPTGYILGARMLALLLMGFGLELLVMLPAGVCWWRETPAVGGGAAAFVLACLLLPLLVMSLTCLFGWLLAMVMGRMRSKTVVLLILSLLILGAYFWGCLHLNRYLLALITDGAAVAVALRGAVWPAYALGMAVASGSWAHLVGFTACCILPFLLVYALLSRFFLQAAAPRRGVARVQYREQTLRVSPVRRALLDRELRRFAANGMYILNAALGSILTLAAAVLLIVYREKLLFLSAAIPLPGALAGAVAAGLCLLCGTDVISAPAISLEGRSLWILRSMPVPARTVLLAKAEMHVVVALPPAVLASLCAILALPMTALEALGVLLLPAAMTAFCGLLGVTVNLHFPKLDYVNETAVIKQSLSVAVTLFGAVGVVLALSMLYVLALSRLVAVGVYLLAVTALLAAGSLLLCRWLGRGGTRRFEAL